MSTTPTVALVHGALTDASGYGGVIRRPQAECLAVRAPMTPPPGQGAVDAYAIAGYATSPETRVLLVGHSYGGEGTFRAASVTRYRLATCPSAGTGDSQMEDGVC